MTHHSFTASKGSLAMESMYLFNASPEKVFKAYTDPTLIPKWWAPEELKVTVEKMEAHPGGNWRFLMEVDGQQYAFRGVYHDVKAPERIVLTWQYEGWPTVMFQTITFEPMPDNKTKMTDTSVFQSLKERDTMIETEMGEGSVPMMERLAKLV